MARFGRTWWGGRFIAALEQFTDPGRLSRGRAYAGNGKIKEYTITGGAVAARVRGSINPYFGVYKEPLYKTTITMRAIAPASWSRVIDHLGTNARLVTMLLLNEMPDTIEDMFAQAGERLMPVTTRDFITTCSCPDYVNPCKHIAGVCYLLASVLDGDPFLLFELRGLAREQLHAELARSPLGKILASELAAHAEEPPIDAVPSFFTAPEGAPPDTAPASTPSHREFWSGRKRLPPLEDTSARSGVPALLIKKQGDFPPFWHKDASFVGVMEELYERVRAKSPQMK
jgi:uncharacterized Zn finger protein